MTLELLRSTIGRGVWEPGVGQREKSIDGWKRVVYPRGWTDCYLSDFE